MARGPEFSLLGEAAQIVYAHTAELTKGQIDGIYSRLKSTVALVGITPETAQHQRSVDPILSPRPYHFIDLPGVFYIRYYGGESLLEVRRVMDLQSGGYVHEDFHVNPQGNITYNLATTDPRGFDHDWHIKKGFVSLGASENDNEVVNKCNALTDQLTETITREGQQTQDIEQAVREIFPFLRRVFRNRKNLALPGMGTVKASFEGSVKTNDRVITLLKRQKAEIIGVHEDGQGYVYSDEGDSHIFYADGGFNLRDPHFLLIRVRELSAALEQVA